MKREIGLPKKIAVWKKTIEPNFIRRATCYGQDMKIELDKIDVKILNALQKNSRITNLALSEVASLSPSACLARVQRLRKAKVIDREIALLTPSEISAVLHSLLEIALSNHKLADHRKFEDGIEGFPEITMAVKVSGRFDYLLSVTTLDMPALNELSDKLLGGNLGIERLVTTPILDIAKPYSGVPIEMLTGIRT